MQRNYVPVWDFRDSNVMEFLRRLESTDFTVLDNEATVDDMCSKFYELLSQPLNAIPCEFVRFSVNDKPWVTPVLKSLINKRWEAFRCKNWSLYNHYKKKVKIEISKAKRIWSQRQSKSPRGLWNIVKSLKGTRQKEPWRRLLLEAGGFQEFLTSLTAELCKTLIVMMMFYCYRFLNKNGRYAFHPMQFLINCLDSLTEKQAVRI